MDTIFLAIGFLSTLFTIAMAVLMLFTFRKERRITLLAPLLSITISLVMLPLFMLISGARLNLLLALPVLALGLALGFLWEFTMRLYYKDGKVMGRHSLLFLLGWAGSWALSQFLSLFGSALLNSLGLIPVFFSTGTQVGLNGNLFLRLLMMPPPPPVPVVEHAPPTLPEWRRLDLGLPERGKPGRRPPATLPERR
jgi:hypothetical protein